MGPRGFLEQVVPWGTGDYVTIHWHRPDTKGFFGRSFQSVDAAVAQVENLRDTTEFNIYFCLSTQKLGEGQRSRTNAVSMCCIGMDLDIKPGSDRHYQSEDEAVEALFHFCDTTGIPYPSLLVATGGGLHAYWLSDVDLAIDDWQPFADGVKHAAQQAGLKCDAGVTGDAARVLRVPGTFNYKYGEPRPVELLDDHCTGDRISFADSFKKILGTPAASRPVRTITHIEIASAFKALPVKALAGDINPDLPPLPFPPIMAECGWMREAYETGGREHDQPQWNLIVLAATFLKDGHELAHSFGNQHPDYSPETTDEIWDRKNRERKAKSLGWPSCKAVADAGSKHCATCAHFGKEKRSPVHLGFEAYANPVDEDLAELGGTRPAGLRLPDGYCVDESGRICAIERARTIKGKTYPPKLVVLLLTVIGEPSLQYQNGHYGIGFIANTDKVGTAEVFLNSSNCYARSGLFQHLADKCVLHNSKKGVPEMVEQFAVSWLDKLLKADTAVRDSGTMGWRYEDGKRVGFVYGNFLYHENGTDVPLLASTDNDFRSWYTPVGDREAWLKACKLLTDRNRPELDVIISVGFAAPLMTFAGTLYGAIVSMWGEPGTAKSTAQQVAAAVFGHPKQTRESLNSTPKSVQGRLGRCRNLAAYWDDIQDERHQDALFSTMFVATQGAEGGRLNTDATMKERLEWQTLLVACSNASFVEYLTRKQKSTTAGMRRVFEIEFNKRADEPGMINHTDAGRVFGALEQNYGVIGAEYARMLANEHVAIDLMVADTIKAFCASVDGNGDEAYWWGTCGVLLAGAMLARRLGAEINIEAMDHFLQQAFHHNRTIRGQEGTEGGSYQNTEQALVGFLNLFVGSGNVLMVDKFFEHRFKPVKMLREPDKSHPIVVQISRDQRKVVFSKRELRDYLHKKEIQARQVFNGLENFFKAKEVRHTLGAGTVYAQGQEVCIEIYIPEDRPHVLLDMLVSQGPSVPRIDHLTVVKPEA